MWAHPATHVCIENMAEFDTKVGEWNTAWKEGHFPWHDKQVNNMLQKHIHDLTEGKPDLCIFVPLCGKTVDLLWLANKGYSVVGAECSRDAIVSFFQESGLEFTTDAINIAPNGGYVHRAKEKDITIFECDIFYLTSDVVGRKVDGVWGRATFSALEGEPLRRKYVNLISSLLAPNGRWMVEIFDFDPKDTFNDGPYPLTLEDAKKLFSEKFTFQMLDQVDHVEGEVLIPPFDKMKHTIRLYLLTFT